MAIDIHIDGNPEEMRAVGGWLRSGLSSAVRDCNDRNLHAHADSKTGWLGAAGDAFRDTLSGAVPKVDELAGDIDAVGRSVERCADDLHTAQRGMRRASEIALRAGLTVTDRMILDPGPAPTVPQALPANASTELVRAHEQARAVHQAHAAKVRAYAAAAEEADIARTVWRYARDRARDFWQSLVDKRYLKATSLTNGLAGALLSSRSSTLEDSAKHFDREANNIARAGRALPSDRGLARRVDEAVRFASSRSRAESFLARHDTVSRGAGAFKVAGVGIAAVGAGWAIHNGKSPSKVILSSGAGTLVSAAVPVAATAVLGGTPVGWTAVGVAVLAVGVGSATSWAVGETYEYAVSDSMRKKIDEGLYAAGDTVGDTVTGAVGALV